ncbi:MULTISPECIES: hypothetical protein [unclassified Pseudoalteromonas]|uniref:hypothetical protein n=1 Tax=unclassified Pseudoalteromonas TaxID=194690 RepID=UPI000C31CA04|nr:MULTISPECIES: hypothetical protein [unclassified Pseudoalteromonas]MDN3473081.1 hypothetical protein [Pseudoalteromonas sp. APC 3355]PKH91136.1 hypothetical protein CXF76_13080 [Pseudoalteromonas sp. 78C3]
MARLTPQTNVLRALFARSGNQCAFPGCTQPMMNNKNKFIGQVCHIQAAMMGGERFNVESDDEFRRSYENLLILCYPHHIETDDVDLYPVERLIQIKNEHEQIFEKDNFKIDEAELVKLAHDMETYWKNVKRLNNIDHIYADTGLAIAVDGDNNFSQIISRVYDAVDEIRNLLKHFHDSDENLQSEFESLLIKVGMDKELLEEIPYYENPFINRNWEYHNLGSTNWLQRLRIDLVHIEVKFLEEYLKTNSNDLIAKASFEEAKEHLKEFANTAIYID